MDDGGMLMGLAKLDQVLYICFLAVKAPKQWGVAKYMARASILIAQTIWVNLGGLEWRRKGSVKVSTEMGWFSYDGQIIMRAQMVVFANASISGQEM